MKTADDILSEGGIISVHSHRHILGAEIGRLREEVRRLQQENERLRKDAELLDFVGEEFLYLEPFATPTGGDDADIGWRVMQHHCGEPTPRVIAESFTESVREAIDAARSAKT